jgi:hypothetical protein
MLHGNLLKQFSFSWNTFVFPTYFLNNLFLKIFFFFFCWKRIISLGQLLILYPTTTKGITLAFTRDFFEGELWNNRHNTHQLHFLSYHELLFTTYSEKDLQVLLLWERGGDTKQSSSPLLQSPSPLGEGSRWTPSRRSSSSPLICIWNKCPQTSCPQNR